MLDSKKSHFVIVPRGVRLSAIVIEICKDYYGNQSDGRSYLLKYSVLYVFDTK